MEKDHEKDHDYTHTRASRLLPANVSAGLIMTGRIHKQRPVRPGPGAAVAVSSAPGRDRVADGQDPRHGA